MGPKFTLLREGDVFKQLVERVRDVKSVLRQWGAYLRAAARAKIEAGEGMPPIAASTAAKYAAQGTASVTRQGKVRASYARQLDQKLRRKGSDDARAELRRLLSGGSLGKDAAVSGNRTVDRLRRRLQTAAAAKSIGARVAMGKKKLERHKLLGAVAGAFKVIAKGIRVVVEDQVPYSGVLSKGGRVGNNAQLPERDFTNIGARARQVLAEIALRWIVGGKE